MGIKTPRGQKTPPKPALQKKPVVAPLKLYEADFIQALKRQLKSPADFYTQVGIENGAVIVDAAHLQSDGWWGFEIKTDQDSLSRLWRQVYHYERVFDYCVLIVGARHLPQAKKLLPVHWGISQLADGQVTTIRKPKRNTPKAESIVRLLWRDEAYGLLTAHGHRRISSATSKKLWNLATQHFSLQDLQTHVARILRSRPTWKK